MKHTLGRLELFGLASTTDTTREATEGNDLFVFHDVAEVSVRLGQFHACRTWFVSVDHARLIADAPERAAATSRMFLKCVRRYSPRARAAVRMRYQFNMTSCTEDRHFSGLVASAAAA